ncbi:Adenylate kinase, active site lid domain protein [Kalmanozyma brasiliensis GHG001]|uniref:Adenylate kinase, active site lid domain protein n=1 Tax=Kalmanozyma brasiliensis (strain GHG001) TaxID=1365824 RepID=UPI001CEB1ADF|nr:Adenylate kinase, active site lid domain protein [Kalmanozyma brasiliensis GHG001]KAF6767630.1 Adenylate kinase, active site lid domain protein [Kalmanozyma brasiliensis GHG001]
MAAVASFQSLRLGSCLRSRPCPLARTTGIRHFSASHARRSDSQMRMLIVGSPGSGKGTQSTRLLKEYSFSVLSAGDVLRSHISRRTEIGQRADAVIKQGGLMPDAVMMDLIGSEVKTLADSDWLLDGFPRTLGQAEMLDSMLEQSGKALRLVINLDVPEDVILDRILQRWTHLPSGRVYNLSYNPPKVEGKDDVTGEPLSKREDDNVETFGKRLKSFHAQTEPMLEHYRKKSGSIVDVDCRSNTNPEETAKGDALFVNLKGDTSNQIWPHLLKVVQSRFPHLKSAT